ncbi:Multidrug efflux pump subunit AcrB [Rhizobiales bacterium GAS191]|nr:Multidrug efflux pump subunit AcrB [Rhizobiales bacterium GAS191]
MRDTHGTHVDDHTRHDESAVSRFNLSAWAVAHRPLALFFAIALALGGAFAYTRLGRAEDPNFTIKVANITAIWPGATSREMQDQVADPIEKKLQELAYFDRGRTYVTPGFMALQLSFRDYAPPNAVPELFYQLRKKLSDIRSDLPASLIGPNVNDEFGDVDSLLFMLTGKGASYRQLKDAAEDMKKALLRVPNVTKVNIYGAQDQTIFVDFDTAKLASLGVAPQTVFDSLSKQNAVAAAGTFETEGQHIPLRVTGALDGVDAVKETPVSANGVTFRLGDIANVTAGYADPPSFVVRQNGVPALGVGVVMAKGTNILSFGKDVQAALATHVATIPLGIDVTQIADQPKVVDNAVFEFLRSFAEAVIIVLGVSFLSLGWRTGIVVATSVPLVLAVVTLVMSALAMDLNRITLGALIIALGLLVDDAIIAVEMMVVKMEQGWPRAKAAGYAWTSTAFPMLTGTLVTAIGFVPIGFAVSAVGEYAGGIFWVVAIALLASWVVAVLFTPLFGVMLLPDHKKAGHAHANPDAVYDTRFYNLLRRVVRFCVRRRVTVTAATLGLFVGAVIAFGHVQQQFFPISDRPELFFEIRMPAGTSIGATQAAAREGEKIIAGDPDIGSYTTYVGQGSPRFWLGLNPQLPDTSYAQIVILPPDVEARERVKTRIEEALARGALSGARVRVTRFNFGPPVDYPVEFRVVGTDPLRLRQIANQLREVMLADPRIVDPNLQWNEREPSLRLVVDQDRARALGLTPQDVAQTLQLLVNGSTITTIRDGTEKIAVVARAGSAERLDPAKVADLTILARDGRAVPVAQIAHIERSSEEPLIWRWNRDMELAVRSETIDGVQPPDVTNALLPKLKPIIDALPAGYRIDTGGAVEESGKANASIFKLFPLMFVLMLTVLMVQLQSFSRLLLVFLTAPLGIIGASLALNVAGRPFGFVALLGLIALAGMIMRNAVILVDQIEADVASGRHTRREAIVEATVRRARPVLLTAFAAILAMIPLSESAFWGPMATTIMGGLFVATFLTLLFLPALYSLWFRRSLDVRAEAPADARASEPLFAPSPALAEMKIAAE